MILSHLEALSPLREQSGNRPLLEQLREDLSGVLGSEAVLYVVREGLEVLLVDDICRCHTKTPQIVSQTRTIISSVLVDDLRLQAQIFQQTVSGFLIILDFALGSSRPTLALLVHLEHGVAMQDWLD